MRLANTCTSGSVGTGYKSRKYAKTAFVLLLLIGIAGASINYSFSQGNPSLRHLFAYPLCALINILLIKWGLRAWRSNIFIAPPMMKTLLFLLLGWGFVMIIRSLDLTPIAFRNLFFNNWGAMPLFLPFVGTFGLRVDFWPIFFQYGKYLMIIGIFYVGFMDLLFLSGIFIRNPLIQQTILFIAPFFFLSGFLRSKRHIYWGALGMLLWSLFEFFVDTRENIVLIGWFFFCSLFEIRRSPVFSLKERIRFIFILLFGVSVVCVYGFQNLYSTFATESLNWRVTMFFFEGGATADTRRGAVDDFFMDMTFEDILIGRGAVTTYHTQLPGLSQTFLQGNSRHLIEIGHLQHTLTGGVVLNILFNWLALGGAFLGLWRSRNGFTRVLAYIILGWVLLMLTAATPVTSPRYFLVWLSIGGCWSKELRAMTTEDFTQRWSEIMRFKKPSRLLFNWK